MQVYIAVFNRAEFESPSYEILGVYESVKLLEEEIDTSHDDVVIHGPWGVLEAKDTFGL